MMYPVKTQFESAMLSLLCLVALFTTGCTHNRVICPDNYMYKVEIDCNWQYAEGMEPQGLTVVFFPDGPEGQIWYYELSDPSGGSVKIPGGKYDVLVYNNGTELNRFNSASAPWDVTVTTVPSKLTPWATVGAPPPDFPPVGPSDPLVADLVENIEVSPCGIKIDGVLYEKGSQCEQCGTYRISVSPTRRDTQYRIKFEHVSNATSVGWAAISLGGPAERLALVSRQPQGTPSAVSSTCRVENDSTLTSQLLSFGFTGPSSILYLYTRLHNGNVKTFAFDVTSQMENQRDLRIVDLVIKGLEFPEVSPPDSIGSGTGAFDVGVEGWQDVVIDLSSKINF